MTEPQIQPPYMTLPYGSDSFPTPVKVSHVETPSVLWLQLRNHTADDICQRIGLSVRMPLDTIRCRQICVAPYKQVDSDEFEWRRAQVLFFKVDTSSEIQFAKLLYIDFGLTIWLNSQMLECLPDEFLHENRQAFRCGLKDFCPANGISWSRECIAALRNIGATEEPFEAKLVDSDGRSYGIELLQPQKEVRNVAEQLEILNLAIRQPTTRRGFIAERAIRDEYLSETPPAWLEPWQCGLDPLLGPLVPTRRINSPPFANENVMPQPRRSADSQLSGGSRQGRVGLHGRPLQQQQAFGVVDRNQLFAQPSMQQMPNRHTFGAHQVNVPQVVQSQVTVPVRRSRGRRRNVTVRPATGAIQPFVEQNGRSNIPGCPMLGGSPILDWFYKPQDLEYFRKVLRALWFAGKIKVMPLRFTALFQDKLPPLPFPRGDLVADFRVLRWFQLPEGPVALPSQFRVPMAEYLALQLGCHWSKQPVPVVRGAVLRFVTAREREAEGKFQLNMVSRTEVLKTVQTQMRSLQTDKDVDGDLSIQC